MSVESMAERLARHVSAAIAEAAKRTDDKRKLIVLCGADHAETLKASLLWKAPPTCFKPRWPVIVGRVEAQIVGAFDSVPVAQAEDAPPMSLALILGEEIVAGVSLLGAGRCAAWGVDPTRAPGQMKTFQLPVQP